MSYIYRGIQTQSKNHPSSHLSCLISENNQILSLMKKAILILIFICAVVSGFTQERTETINTNSKF